MVMLHEFWAAIIEVAIACYLLYRYLGVAFVAPIIMVVLCVFLTAGVASFTSDRQKEWMKKIQARVGIVRTPVLRYFFSKGVDCPPIHFCLAPGILPRIVEG